MIPHPTGFGINKVLRMGTSPVSPNLELTSACSLPRPQIHQAGTCESLIWTHGLQLLLTTIRYIYGGRNGADPPRYFDDIWVLSLPSFTWTKVYSGISPRFAHTCHLVGNRTLVTVGGVATEAQMEGQFDPSLYVAACDWEVKGVGVMDISQMTWGSVYSTQRPAYEVPQAVVKTIGGE